MKKLLLFASIALFSVFTASSQCTWTINSIDSWGDGWNGNAIDIQLNGVSVPGSPYTLPGGSSGTFTFTVNTGDVIDIIWDNTGSWDSEVGFQLLDSDGLLVHDQPTGSLGSTANGTVLYNGTTSCPPCPAPGNLSATNITDVSADLNWDASANSITYDVEWGLPGFVPNTGSEIGSSIGINTITTSATGLTASTDYEFYVMSVCTSPDSSAWVGPFAFATVCATSTLPWSDDIESHTPSTIVVESMCWNASATSSYDWNVTGSGTTPSSNTGALAANSGNQYFYTEASGASLGAEALIESPNIDVSGLTLPAIEFYYHMTGGQMGDLITEMWDGSAWIQLDTISGQQQANQNDPFLKRTVYATAIFPSTFKFRFRAISAGSFEGDICIDDISVIEAPVCPDPTSLVGTYSNDSIMTSWNWMENPVVQDAVTGFNIQYGFGGSNTVINGSTNFSDTTVDNTLIGGSVYDIYVQAVCANDTSGWTGPIQIIILPIPNDSTCDAMALNVDGTVYNFNNTGATTQTNETTIVPPVTGAGNIDGWSDGAIELTTWFTFTAPASGNVKISGEDAGYIGQMAVYETTDCSDLTTFTLIGANDNGSPTWNQSPVDFILCGLISGNTYYLMHDNRNAGDNGTYSIRLEEIIAEAGTSTGLLTVCTGDTVNVQSGITGFDIGYVWTEMVPTANFTDSTFPTAGLAYQVFDFQYTVTKGCAVDSVIQQVQIYGPSSAGIDGTISVCQNQPVNLYSGLSGNVDFGGQWYDPSNNTTPSAITSSSIPGSFNYDYITSNGVCPSDTANVVMTVDAACNWADIDELVFGDVTIYPNPTSGLVYISNNSSTEVFNYEVTDINGRVIATSKSSINGSETAEVSLNALEDGIYMIRLFNENAEKTYRVIKN